MGPIRAIGVNEIQYAKGHKFRLRDLLRHNLQTVRAYLLKEDSQQFWEYESATWAGKFLNEWCRSMRSRIEPIRRTPDVGATSGSDSQLLQGQKAVLQWYRRGPEQQGQSHHEKILGRPHLPHQPCCSNMLSTMAK